MKKIIKNDYFFNLINKVYSVVLGVFSSIFLTRYLGVEHKGNYAYVMQIVNISVIILNLGLYQSYAYNYKNKVEMLKEKYLNIFFVQFIFLIIISLILSIIISDMVYTVMIFIIPINTFKLQLENVMLVENIRLKIKVNMIYIFVLLLFNAILYFVFEKTDIIYPIISLGLLSITNITIYIKKLGVHINFKLIDKDLFVKILKFGFIPMLTSLLLTLNYSLDIIFLKWLSDPINLSIYSMAAAMVNYLWLIPDVFKDVLFSRLAKTDSIIPIIYSIKISVYIILMIIIIFAFFGKYVIFIMYGLDFVKGFLVTLILFLASLSMVFFKIIGVLFIAEGRTRFFFYTLLTSVIINVILNIIFIPKTGMYGAAISSLVSYGVCGISFLIYFCVVKNLKIKDIFLFSKKDIFFLKQVLKSNRQ